MKLVYEYVMSGITINDNPMIGMILLAIFDFIAYKIAYRTSNSSTEHWSARIIILVVLSILFVSIVNLIKWVMTYWMQLLLIFIAAIIIVSVGLYLMKVKKKDETK